MVKIIFKNRGEVAEVEKGLSVLEAALESHVPIFHTCGGNCSCSTCRVRVLRGAENLSPMEEAEAQVLDAFDLASPHRLGCQALLLGGEVVVEIPVRDRPCRPNKTPSLTKDMRGTY